MKFPLGEMTVGDILDRGLKLLFTRLPLFYAINLIVLSPVFLLQVTFPLVLSSGAEGGAGTGAAVAMIVFGVAAVILALILQPIGTAAILHIVMEEYVGRRASIGEAFSFALTRLWPLLGASILYAILLSVGFLLCCVPGFLVLAVYSLVTQVVVLERLGVGEGFQRSQALTSGFRGRVLGVLLLLSLATGIAQVAMGHVLTLVLPAQEVVPAGAGFRVQVNPLNHVVDTLAASLVNILFTTYMAVCTTLLYLDLRIRKEGFDLELAVGGGPDGGDGYRPDRDDDRFRDDDLNRDDRP